MHRVFFWGGGLCTTSRFLRAVFPARTSVDYYALEPILGLLSDPKHCGPQTPTLGRWGLATIVARKGVYGWVFGPRYALHTCSGMVDVARTVAGHGEWMCGGWRLGESGNVAGHGDLTRAV